MFRPLSVWMSICHSVCCTLWTSVISFKLFYVTLCMWHGLIMNRICSKQVANDFFKKTEFVIKKVVNFSQIFGRILHPQWTSSPFPLFSLRLCSVWGWLSANVKTTRHMSETRSNKRQIYQTIDKKLENLISW